MVEDTRKEGDISDSVVGTVADLNSLSDPAPNRDSSGRVVSDLNSFSDSAPTRDTSGRVVSEDSRVVCLFVVVSSKPVLNVVSENNQET